MWHVLLFEIHPVATIAVVGAHAVLAIALAIGISNWTLRAFGAEAIPVAPYFVSVTTLLSIIFAFIAVETWSVNKEAGSAARLETEAFERLADVVRQIPDKAEQLQNLLFVYAYEVENNEWGAEERNIDKGDTDIVLSQMRLETTRLALEGLSGPVTSEIYRSIDQLSEARRTRLSIVHEHGDGYKWSLLFTLSLFAHVAVGLVHADKRLARFISLVLFSSAVCSSLAIMAIHDNPYTGPSALAKPKFLAIQARMF